MRLSLKKAIALIKQEEVVAVPTETVYGLAGSIRSQKALEKIFALKQRPSNNPLITHLSSADEILVFVKELPPGFDALAKAFWPGPLTLVVPVIEEALPTIVRAGLKTAAFRVPQNLLAMGLIQMAGPIVMPSANLSGRPSSTEPSHVESDFGEEFPVLDGGVCLKGVESTVLIFQADQWHIGRLGAISPEMIGEILGYLPITPKLSKKQPLCPGQLYRHYAPSATLYLEKEQINESACIIGFHERTYPNHRPLILLGSLNKPEEVAQNLYKALRELDEQAIKSAWIDMDFPKEGLWNTIRERILKAAG